MKPRTGVFVYPRDFKSTSKKPSIGAGQQWRHLMSVFYTSKELIDRGNSMGVNEKEGLSKEIVKAIIDYMVIKGIIRQQVMCEASHEAGT